MSENLWMRKTIGGTSLTSLWNHPVTFVLGGGVGIVIGAIVYTLVFSPALELLGISSDLDWVDRGVIVVSAGGGVVWSLLRRRKKA